MNQEDSSPEFPYTGWIKREPEESEDEFFIKEEPDDMSGNRFDELMNLSKEDLVTKIMQQEEVIRYLKDIRNDLQSNIKELSSSCGHMKTLMTDMLSAISNLKDHQKKSCTSVSVSTSDLATRANSKSEQSDGNSAPSTSGSSDVPTTSNFKPEQSKVSLPSSTAVTTSSATVFKQQSKVNGFVSPNNTATSASRQVFKAQQKSNSSKSPSSVVSTPTTVAANFRSQQSKVNCLPTTSGASTASSVTAYREQQTKANSMMTVTTTAMTSAVSTFKDQQSKTHYVATASSVSTSSTVSSLKEHSNSKSSSSVSISNAVTTSNQRPSSKMPGSEISSVSRDASLLLSSLPKVPSGLTISIAEPKKTPSRPNERQGTETESATNVARIVPLKSSGTVHRKPTASAKVQRMSSSALSSAINLPSGLSVNPIPEKRLRMALKDEVIKPTSFSNPNRNSPFEATEIKKEPEEEEEEEDSGEEVSILTPDMWASQTRVCRSNAPATVSAVQTVFVNQFFTNVSDRRVESEYISSPLLGDENESFDDQDTDMFIREELGDYDIDENDTKEVYLADDVSLPRQLVDACMRQGPTPAKLTRNLMTTLFPDLRELASSCVMGQPNVVKGPAISPLPENKVNAIIGLVQKTFPQCKRSSIVFAMNAKCNEARKLLGKASRTRSRIHHYE